jgi:hypothetical protein
MHYLVFLICMWLAVIFLAVHGFRPNYFTELFLWISCMVYAHEKYGGGYRGR